MPVCILLILIFVASPCFGQVLKESPLQAWTVGEHRWSVEEERKFAKWVDETITEDFFVRYKIPVDCADVPYAVRWIYSRIAHLPAAATTKDGTLIGHWSTEWGRLPTHPEWHKDQRFRAALLRVLSDTTTRTLPLDTYPARIDRDSVQPGTAFFITESHSGIVGHLILDGSSAHPVQTWEATVPAKPQKMSLRNFLSPRPESIVRSGLVKFRWPVSENGHWNYMPVKSHPFYSEEQYGSAFYEGHADFVEAVAKRVDPTPYDPLEKAEKVIETIARYLQDRVPVVLDGFRRCRSGGCPEGSPLWEIHSTPGRDGMIMLLMDHLHQIIDLNRLDGEVLRRRMEKIVISVSKNQSVTFYHVYQNYPWLSPHPEDPIKARWGLMKCEMILSRMISACNSISFIERTYRKRDPRYADFATGQQEETLRRLREEGRLSDCEGIGLPPVKQWRDPWGELSIANAERQHSESFGGQGMPLPSGASAKESLPAIRQWRDPWGDFSIAGAERQRSGSFDGRGRFSSGASAKESLSPIRPWRDPWGDP
jgi:hypothetical protein